MSSEPAMGRRSLLRGACLSAIAALAGCLQSRTTPEATPGTPPGTNPQTEAPGSVTPDPSPRTDVPAETPGTSQSVYVDDLLVQNVDDADHRVTVSVTREGTTVFEDTFEVAGNGGGRRVEVPVFEAAGIYRVTVTVDDGAAGYTAREEVSVTDSDWRRYTGVMVSVEAATRVEIRRLHADPPPTATNRPG